MYNASQSLKNGGYMYVNQDQYRSHDIQTQQNVQNLLYKQHQQNQQQQHPHKLSAPATTPLQQNSQQIATTVASHHDLVRIQQESRQQEMYLRQTQHSQQMQKQYYINHQLQSPRAKCVSYHRSDAFPMSPGVSGMSGRKLSAVGEYSDSRSAHTTLPSFGSSVHGIEMSGMGSTHSMSHLYPVHPESSREGLSQQTGLSSTGAPCQLSSKPTMPYETPLDLSVTKEAPLDLTIGRKRPFMDNVTHAHGPPSVFRTPTFEKHHVDRLSSLNQLAATKKEVSIKALQKHASPKQQFTHKHSGFTPEQGQVHLSQVMSDATRESYDNAYGKEYARFLAPHGGGITKAVSNGTTTIKAEIPFNIPQTDHENRIVRIENRNQVHLSGSSVLKGDQYQQQHSGATQQTLQYPTSYGHDTSKHQYQNSPVPVTSSPRLKEAYGMYMDPYQVAMIAKTPTEAMMASMRQHRTSTPGLEPGEICRNEADPNKTVTLQPYNLAGGSMHTLPTGVRLHRTQDSIKPFYHEKHVAVETDPNRIPVANVNPIVHTNRSALPVVKQTSEPHVDHAIMMERSFRTNTPLTPQIGTHTYGSNYNQTDPSLYKNTSNLNDHSRRIELLTKIAEMSEKEKVINWLDNIPDPIQLQENPSYTSLLPEAELESVGDNPDAVTHISASCSMTQTENNRQSSTTGSHLLVGDAGVLRNDDTSRDSDVHHKKISKHRIMAPLEKKTSKNDSVKQEPMDDPHMCYKESFTDNYINTNSSWKGYDDPEHPEKPSPEGEDSLMDGDAVVVNVMDKKESLCENGITDSVKRKSNSKTPRLYTVSMEEC